LAKIQPSAYRLEEELHWMKNKLVNVGGLLATVPGQIFMNMPKVTARDLTKLERLVIFEGNYFEEMIGE
jgi:cob(I)alamin adenosyltransferase